VGLGAALAIATGAASLAKAEENIAENNIALKQNNLGTNRVVKPGVPLWTCLANERALITFLPRHLGLLDNRSGRLFGSISWICRFSN
jgi:hypothetical protein